MKTTITSVSGGWLKLTPTEILPPGEYASSRNDGEGRNESLRLGFRRQPQSPRESNPWKPEARSRANPSRPKAAGEQEIRKLAQFL